MLRKGQRAAELAEVARTIDGKPLALAKLAARGPVMLVLLRGFS